MQPRLVAITYPSTEQGGKKLKTKKSKLFRKPKSEPVEVQEEPTPLYRRIRRLTWHDLKSQISIVKRPRASYSDDVKFEIFDTSLSSAVASTVHIERIPLSKWQSIPADVQANVLKYLEAAYNPVMDIKAHWLRRRDIMAVQSSCKAWSEAAEKRLYETISLKPSYDYDWCTSPPTVCHTRLLQLRRTLRSNQKLADLVKHLVLLPNNSKRAEKETASLDDLVASMVMACRNLESLTSYHVPYTHRFTRYHHALSTRTQLTKHTWVIGEDEFSRSRAGRMRSAGILSSQQTRLFLSHHALWQNLETLNVISHNGKGIIEHELFVKVLKMLPKLKRCHFSCFDSNDFSDDTLLALPPLTSLRLDRCFGVTEAGLCRWAQLPQAASIHRLVLESQNITSLLTIAELFSHLTALEVFRMVQLEFEPGLPLELDITRPLLSSSSLHTLEWFVASSWDPEIHSFRHNDSPEKLHEKLQSWSHSKDTQHILSSILDYGFPRLRKVLLPGYGSLSGLLRWVRHTAPSSEPAKLPPQHLTLKEPPYSAPVMSLRRENSRSGRPSSPSFVEYDHWRKPSFPGSTNASVTALGTTTKPPSPILETTTSTTTTSRSSSPASSRRLSDSDINSNDAQSSRTSSPSPPPQDHPEREPKKQESVSRSSSTTMRPTGHPSDAENFALAPSPIFDDIKSFSINYFPGPHHQHNKSTATDELDDDDDTRSRRSSISILLDGYAYTA